MSRHVSETVEGQLAQRLFGWRCDGVDWTDAEGLWHRTPPAYTTDPAATAQVWQWLEAQRGPHNWQITFAYWPGKISCRLTKYVGAYTLAHEAGATWPEALCRAALALAAALAEETTP